MDFEVTKEYVENLRDIITRKDETAALKIMKELHAADIAGIYHQLDMEEAKYLYMLLDGEKAADVFAELEEHERKYFFKELPGEVVVKQFIEKMDSDDAADIINELPEEKQQELLSYIKDIEQAGAIIDLLNYDEYSAGGLMAKELIAVNENLTAIECIAEIRRQAEQVDELYNIYVVDNYSKLIGVLPLKKLLISKPNVRISTICEKDIKKARTESPAEDVANVMDKYDLVSIPVVDSIGRLVGRITIDDIVDFIKEEAERDYQLISGITEDIETRDKVWVITRARIPWLLIGLLGGILGAQIISYYETDIANYVGLALYLPLIAAMGGNVGVQSSAIIVQGLANKTLGASNTFRKLGKEFFVALINGIVCSSLIFGYNMFFSDSFALTLSVSIALFSVIIFASIFGTFVPLILNKAKIDPALATGPFITTVNDIMGLFLYLMISRVIFGSF